MLIYGFSEVKCETPTPPHKGEIVRGGNAARSTPSKQRLDTTLPERGGGGGIEDSQEGREDEASRGGGERQTSREGERGERERETQLGGGRGRGGHDDDDEEEVYQAGDVVEVRCNSNYVLMGEPVLVCQNDGTWSSTVPTCESHRQFLHF